jgi:hypothetical protein
VAMPHPLFPSFLSKHPEHAAWSKPVAMPDGTIEQYVSAEVLEAFFRWLLVHGHGDAQRINAVLTKILPALKALGRRADA